MLPETKQNTLFCSRPEAEASEGVKSPAHSKMLVEALWLNLDIDTSNGAYYHKNGKVQIY